MYLSGIGRSRKVTGSSYVDILDNLCRIVGDHLGIPGTSLSLEMDIQRDLGGDHIDRVELVMTVEECFGIRIEKEVAQAIRTLRDLYKAVLKSQSGDRS